ncbi:MAG: hypothetical protein ACM3VZ_13115 [Acidobacteriota bacterium]
MTSTLKELLQRRLQRRQAKQPLLQRAQALLDAIDAGGIPLNPAIVNDIARQLGLDVSSRAPMDETIERIRAAVARGATAPRS